MSAINQNFTINWFLIYCLFNFPPQNCFLLFCFHLTCLVFFYHIRSLTAEHIPFDADDLVVLICNSNVKHNLSASEYPTRRKQCNDALELMGLSSYREANLSHLKGECTDDILFHFSDKSICKFDLRLNCHQICWFWLKYEK